MHNGDTMNDELRDLIIKLEKKYSQEIAKAITILNDQSLDSKEKIAQLEKDFDKQFLLHFIRIEERFTEAQTNTEDLRLEMRVKFDQLYALVDSDIKQREKDEQEWLIMGHQLSRHEQWFDQLAEEARVRLNPSR